MESTDVISGPPAKPKTPRSRAELAILVAEWMLAWRPQGLLADGPPRDLFHEDELPVVESFEPWVVTLATCWLLDSLADHVDVRSEPGDASMARKVREFSGYVVFPLFRR